MKLPIQMRQHSARLQALRSFYHICRKGANIIFISVTAIGIFLQIGKRQLGNDLSSDICGIAVDDDTIYCSIRNGRIVALDRHSHLIRESTVSKSSMWSIKAYDKYMICGTVDGELLLLDKSHI